MNKGIEVAHLAKQFGSNQVLKDVSFSIKPGMIFALLGSNGSGKTTTVNILSTLLLPDSGKAMVGGFDVVHEDQKVRSCISLTGQFAAVDELLTGEENLLMMGRFSHIEPSVVRTKTARLIKQLDLVEAAKRPAATYSGGMRRRLDLAISLLASPSIIFLDEPTTGLDPRSRQEVWRIVKKLAAEGTTVFLTTQYLEEADQLADKIGVLHGGRIVAEGTAEDLKKQTGGELVELTFADKTSFEQARNLIEPDSQNLIPRVTRGGAAPKVFLPKVKNFRGGPSGRTREGGFEGLITDGKTSLEDNSKALMLSITTDGTPEALRKLLNDLAAKNLHPNKVNMRKPTLDDVFMQLTNKKEI